MNTPTARFVPFSSRTEILIKRLHHLFHVPFESTEIVNNSKDHKSSLVSYCIVSIANWLRGYGLGLFLRCAQGLYSREKSLNLKMHFSGLENLGF